MIQTIDTSRCGWCRVQLDHNAASPDFCGWPCQDAWHAEQAGQPIPPAAVLARLEVGMRPIFDEIGRAFRGLAESLRPAIEALQRAGVLVEPSPADRMAYALHLRRTRNTGPADRRRPPARIDPARTRR